MPVWLWWTIKIIVAAELIAGIIWNAVEARNYDDQ